MASSSMTLAATEAEAKSDLTSVQYGQKVLE
jgi:hypothetical protein